MTESDFVEKFLEKFLNIQKTFLDFIEDEENIDANFNNLIQLFEDIKIRDDKYDVRLFLHQLLKVSNNHHHGQNFFSKIYRILFYFKNDLIEYQSEEIFQLFKNNKKILLFLIEEKILIIDENFVKQIIKQKFLAKGYPQYFAPEIKPFIDEKWFPKYDPNDVNLKGNWWVEEIKKELPNNFYGLRKIGENDHYLCKLIREDLVEDFIVYVNKNLIRPDKKISPSIYETNSFLIKNNIILEEQNQPDSDEYITSSTLIEYAAFFGSIQIIKYLINQKVDLTESLWFYAISSKNAELIHLLEYYYHTNEAITEEEKEYDEELYKMLFNESIKCNHNEFANYFLDSYLQNEDKNSNETIIQCLKYYNFAFLQKEHIDESSFCQLCHYDYYLLADHFLRNTKVDINSKAILKNVFQWNSKSYL